MKYFFVINPAAGKDENKKFIADYLSKRDDIDYKIYTTTKPGDGSIYVKDMCQKYKDEQLTFFGVGGDGTLNEVLNGAMGYPNAAIGIIPCGSGNDFVKYYGGIDNFKIEELISGKTVKVDVMKVNDRYSINVVDMGLTTMVLKAMRKVKRLPLVSGKMAYYLGIVYALFTAMKNKCHIYCQGKDMSTNGVYLLASFANGQYYGGSFKCAPASVNDDGLMEICVVKPVSLIKLAGLIGIYAKGLHLDPKYSDVVSYTRSDKVTLDYEQDFDVSLDGEIITGKHFEIENIHNAINFTIKG